MSDTVDIVNYKDETASWIDLIIPANQAKVIRYVDTLVETKDEATGKKSKKRDRYAIVTFDSDNPKIKGKEFKAYNRTDGENFIAFAQLSHKVRAGMDGLTTDDLKIIGAGKRNRDGSVIPPDPAKVKELLNQGLQATTEEFKFRINPKIDKIECVVSPKYVPITNKELFQHIDSVVGPVEIEKQFHNDRRSLFQILPEKFAHLSDTENFGFFFSNSFRGGCSIGVGEFVLTLVCSNGLMVQSKQLTETSQVLSELSRKHVGEKDLIIEQFRSALDTIDNRLSVLYKQIEEAKKIEFPVAIKEIETIPAIKEAFILAKKSQDKIESLIEEKYTGNTVWDLISAITEAAQDAPANSREHMEKVAGELLNQYIPITVEA
ncbi:MAG: hypothetical protein ACFFDI_31190 [Promethearchaeota archaeon]